MICSAEGVGTTSNNFCTETSTTREIGVSVKTKKRDGGYAQNMSFKTSCSDWRQLTKITVGCLACECEEGSMQRQLLLTKAYYRSELPASVSICMFLRIKVSCMSARFQLQTWQCCSSDQGRVRLEEHTPLGMMPQIVWFIIVLVLWKHLLWQKFYMFCLGVQFSPVQTSHWTSQVALHSCAIAASGLLPLVYLEQRQMISLLVSSSGLAHAEHTFEKLSLIIWGYWFGPAYTSVTGA